MHLGNGAITPECGFVALGIAAAGVGVAVTAARAAGLKRHTARTAGALGAAVFAAQMFNVDILPFSSVHLIGGVLLAWVLGPALGALSMAVILTLQALLLGDGGLLSLGVNVINMALLPAIGVAIARRWTGTGAEAAAGTPQSLQRPSPQVAPVQALTLGATAFLCTVAAAGLIVLEVAAGRGAAQLAGIGEFAIRMLAWHGCAGLLEGAATVAIVAALAKLAENRAGGLQLSPRGAGSVAAAALLVAALSVPAVGLASAAPDAYQAALAVAEKAGVSLGQIETGPSLSGINRLAQSWQDRLLLLYTGPETVLFLLGTVLAGAAVWVSATLAVAERAAGDLRTKSGS